MAFPPTLASYGPAADVGIWVHVIDDTYRLTTMGEYWSDVWNTPGYEEAWMQIFAEDPPDGEDPVLYGFGPPLEDPMLGDGVSLRSCPHPASPWYERLLHWFRPARLSAGSLETIEITVRDSAHVADRPTTRLHPLDPAGRARGVDECGCLGPPAQGSGDQDPAGV